MKQKHFHKGIEQLVQEGAIRSIKHYTRTKLYSVLLDLQFEVFEHRMKMNIMLTLYGTSWKENS